MGAHVENRKQQQKKFSLHIQVVWVKIFDPSYASTIPQRPLTVFERGGEIVTSDLSPEVYWCMEIISTFYSCRGLFTHSVLH